MNHNELVGWETDDESHLVLMIQTPEDHKRTRIRMEVCMEISSNKELMLWLWKAMVEMPCCGF